MDEWVSEGVQVGGVASAMGVLGLWTGAQHEHMDPLGVYTYTPLEVLLTSALRTLLDLEGWLNTPVRHTAEHERRDMGCRSTGDHGGQ